jgi:hypothetical protein
MMQFQTTAQTMSRDTGISALKLESASSERLNQLFRLWNDLRSERGLPFRDALGPEQISFILGNVTMIDVDHDPLTFRFRLIGTRIEEAGRRGDQGKTLDQIEPAFYRDMLGAAYYDVVESGEPLCHQISYALRRHLVSFERLVLPFTRTGNTVDLLLEALDWLPGVRQDLKNLVIPASPSSGLHCS